MNNQVILTETSSKNWVIVFVILIGLMLGSITINAQSINNPISFDDAKVENYLINDFNVKEVNNKLYFKLLVVENDAHTNYTLESSSNGSEFFAVQLKEGFKSPNGQPLLYCYSVDLNILNDNIYRIRRDSPNGTSYSSVIELDNNAPLNLSAQKN